MNRTREHSNLVSKNIIFADVTNDRVGVGTTSPTTRLSVAGAVTAVDFNTTSDRRLKENIKTISSAVEKIEKIDGVTFDWKESGKPSAGVIAQNIEEVFPELVIVEETKDISQNAEKFHNFTYQTMTVEKDGELISVEVPVDEIDLIDDFDDDDLSDEGRRSLGIIELDHDTTQGFKPTVSHKEKMLVGKLEMVNKTKFSDGAESSYDDYLITCPYTGSTDVYQISSNVYASYETNEPFKVSFRNLDEED
jgi:hypothetical protein